MRGIAYAGRDLSPYCAAEVTGRAAHAIAAEAMAVPGRAGALVTSTRVPPQDVGVRLTLDPGHSLDAAGLAGLRRHLRSWLTVPEGGTLTLPDDPERFYRDALLTYAGDWEATPGGESCELTFTLFDPVAYGTARAERTAAFDVGGTWPAAPTVFLVAEAGGAVEVAHPAGGRAVRVERDFAGGEAVVIDCAGGAVTVGGADARADVALGSDFFSLAPGPCELSLSGCSSFIVRFRERWL